MNPQIYGVLIDMRWPRGARRLLHAGADEEEPARHPGDGDGPPERRTALSAIVFRETTPRRALP
jgi:hypothetical protein